MSVQAPAATVSWYTMPESRWWMPFQAHTRGAAGIPSAGYLPHAGCTVDLAQIWVQELVLFLMCLLQVAGYSSQGLLKVSILPELVWHVLG